MKILNWQLFLEELVGETEISDLDRYIEGMEKSMQDKLFFVSQLDFDVIVDFGCANGSFLSKVKQLKPNIKIIGYDLDETMLKRARYELGEEALLTDNWNQVVDNIFTIREKIPGNVLFYIQECTSNLIMLYFGEVKNWVAKHFNTNRFGDQTDYSTQLAVHSYLDVNVITTEYFDSIKNTEMSQFLRPGWQESPEKIRKFIAETEKFDKLRGQNWKETFPEVANFYSRYFK
jgi:hypothetical protein